MCYIRKTGISDLLKIYFLKAYGSRINIPTFIIKYI